MSDKEDLHRLTDHLPDERLEQVRDLLASLQNREPEYDEQTLSSAECSAIRSSLDYIKSGRTVSFEQIKRENGLLT